MSIEEVEKLAKEQAQEEGAACLMAEEDAEKALHAEEESGECGDGGCPSCDDSLPGEQKERDAQATVKAAASEDEGCGDGCGCH